MLSYADDDLGAFKRFPGTDKRTIDLVMNIRYNLMGYEIFFLVRIQHINRMYRAQITSLYPLVPEFPKCMSLSDTVGE